MRSTGGLGVVFCTALVGCRPPKAPALPSSLAARETRDEVSVASVSWLVGSWSMSEGDAVTTEQWSAPTEGSMFGQGSAVQGGAVVFTESLRLEVEDGGLVYIAQPEGAAASTRFKATEIRPFFARFENPDHDDPKSIEYRRNGDALHVAIDGDGGPRRWVLQRKPTVEAPQTGGVDPAVLEYARRYRNTQLAGMSALTGWAAVNLVSGLAGALTVKSDQRYIHEMNAMWNLVNLPLGIAGLVAAPRTAAKIRDRQGAEATYKKVRLTFAINGGLDVLYIASGVALAEVARKRGIDRAEGYGISIGIQGAFLMVYDMALLIAHERAWDRLTLTPIVARGHYGLGAGAFF